MELDIIWLIDIFPLDVLIRLAVTYKELRQFLITPCICNSLMIPQVDTIEELVFHYLNYDPVKAIKRACKLGYLPAVKRAFIEDKYRGDITLMVKNDAVIEVSKNGHLEVVKYLVSQGADIKTRDNYAVRWASRNGHLEVVKYLVSQGADIKTRDNYAVIWASRNRHLEVIKYLVSQGADIKDQNNKAVRLASTNDILK